MAIDFDELWSAFTGEAQLAFDDLGVNIFDAANEVLLENLKTIALAIEEEVNGVLAMPPTRTKEAAKIGIQAALDSAIGSIAAFLEIAITEVNKAVKRIFQAISGIVTSAISGVLPVI